MLDAPRDDAKAVSRVSRHNLHCMAARHRKRISEGNGLWRQNRMAGAERRHVLCGERTERQAAALFGGVRMVGSCLIWIPGLASIIKRKSPPSLPEGGGLLVGSVWGRQASGFRASACENALQVDEARRMGGGIEIAPPCGPCSSASDHRHAGIAAACRALAIEDEINGKAIRLSLQEHGSGGSISMAHDAPHSRREGRVSGNL